MGGDPAASHNERPELEEAIRLLSHQLKAPVGAIRSLLDGISEGAAGEVSPQVAHILERVKIRAAEALELISGLLDYEAYGRGAEVSGEEIDVLDVMSRLLARLEPLAADREVSLHDALPRESRAWLRGDRRALEQALGNILDNAVKYTPARGVVGVAAEIDDSGIHIHVSDTGAGIPPEDLGRIFEPFYRSPRSKSALAGTGLGLALSRKIVEAHGGSIDVTSRLGEGSTFIVTLPLERVESLPSGARVRRRVVIIGGVTAGPKAASRLRRLDPDAEITMIEKGEFLSYSGCGLPRYISGAVRSPRELMSTEENAPRTARFFQSVKDVRVLGRTLATSIDRDRRVVRCTDLGTGRDIEVPYDALVLATGTVPCVPEVPGIGNAGVFTPYDLESAREMKKLLESSGPVDAFVVGGGFVGIAMAESLVEAGARVTLVEKRRDLMARAFDSGMARRVQEELERRGVRVFTSAEIMGIEPDRGQLRILMPDRTLHADLLVLAAGVSPNTELARNAGIDIGESGGIRVNGRLQTSDPRIYAVGDCAQTPHLVSERPEFLPLGSVSTKMGRIVADVIAGREAEYRGSVGTALLRVFDLNVGRSGLTEAVARERGFDAVSATVSGLDRPHYVEGAAEICLTVTADRRSRVLLGVQGIGKGDVVPRIQVLAAAVTRGMRLEEVFALDLGYNPAYGTPIDISQTACLFLQNVIEGLVVTIRPEEMADEGTRARVVDVSPVADYSVHACPGSVNVPLENIRREGIPFGKDEVVVICGGSTSRSYEAYRILAGKGWRQLRVLESPLSRPRAST